jgi:hypothetical protein
MVIRELVKRVDYFDKPLTYTTTSQGDFGWTIADTSAAGTPTYLNQSGRGAVLTCDAQVEAQNVCLYQADVLPYPTTMLQYVAFDVSVSGLTSVATVSFGLGTARNDTILSVTSAAMFRILGSASTSNVLCDCRDGTNTNNSVSSATTLSSTVKRFEIDFAKGLADIRFYIDGARVAAATTFTMAALTSTSNLQLITQLQKTSNAATPSVTIKRVEVQYRTADGA